MRTSHILNMLLACSFLALTGCEAPSGSDDLPDDLDLPLEPAALARDPPPSGLNGLTPACFWGAGSQQALRALGAAGLDQGDGVLQPGPSSLVPAGCRGVLEKAVQCALPEGETLLDPVTGEEYGGWWGLAPSWRNGALDTDGRRYVTACLAQNLNATGTSVPILLEGPNAAIQESATLSSVYTIQESTAFGDLFSSTTPLSGLLPAFNLYVCWESALPQSCGALALPLLGERICDDLVLCGIVPVGPCSLACAPNGPYHKCKPGLLSPYWTQTVRVRLHPDTCE